ncbi:unnamed protein product, partial [Iphiclides podalirius]
MEFMCFEGALCHHKKLFIIVYFIVRRYDLPLRRGCVSSNGKRVFKENRSLDGAAMSPQFNPPSDRSYPAVARAPDSPYADTCKTVSHTRCLWTGGGESINSLVYGDQLYLLAAIVPRLLCVCALIDLRARDTTITRGIVYNNCYCAPTTHIAPKQPALRERATYLLSFAQSRPTSRNNTTHLYPTVSVYNKPTE